MVNLRFHIVSIVAVFLALSIGIFTGSTLLDRTILDGLEGRQASLDRRNDDLKADLDTFEGALNTNDAADADFAAAALDLLDSDTLQGTSVLVVATTGVDDAVVAQTTSLVTRVGGSALGVLWAGEAADLSDAEIARRMSASWWGTNDSPSTADPAATLTSGMADVLATSGSPTPAVPDEETTSTTLADAPPETTSTEPGPQQSPEAQTAPGTASFARLIEDGFLEWDPSIADDAFALPASGVVTVVLTGEDADLGPVRFVYPLVDALAGRSVPLIVGEIHSPRATVDRLTDDNAHARGFIVDRFREQPETSESVTTIDNVDHPYGRLAVILAMRSGRLPAGGAFGFGDTSDVTFPTGS